MMFELPAATAMALMGLPMLDLMLAHVGPVDVVLVVCASVVRQSCSPPPKTVWLLLGSRMKGAMKLAEFVIASSMRNGGFFQAQADPFQYCPLMYSELLAPPPVLLRWMFRKTYSPYRWFVLFGSAAEKPPSPPKVATQPSGTPLYTSVPLSWVPPTTLPDIELPPAP